MNRYTLLKTGTLGNYNDELRAAGYEAFWRGGTWRALPEGLARKLSDLGLIRPARDGESEGRKIPTPQSPAYLEDIHRFDGQPLVPVMAEETFTDGFFRNKFIELGYRPEWSAGEIRKVPQGLADRLIKDGTKLVTQIPEEALAKQAPFASLNRLWLQKYEGKLAVQMAGQAKHDRELEEQMRLHRLVARYDPAAEPETLFKLIGEIFVEIERRSRGV